MYRQIKKRDGRAVDFQPKKITDAIAKAGQATGEFEREQAEEFTAEVLTRAGNKTDQEIPQVEQIQDLVEEVLLESPYKQTAKAYILYRDQHRQLRDVANKMNNDLVDKYLGQLDWLVKENSNMTYSLQGLNNHIAGEVSKRYWLDKIYPQEIREAHLSGDLHIHDLGILSVYCVGWDLLDLLQVGFTGVSGKISSKPPKHFRAALGQITNFFYTLQGESAGAQAFSNFDTLLAPFIRYDGLDYRGVKQAMQEFVFNINVPTRVGFQTPFTNITLDLNPPPHLAGQSVISGGKPQKETYGEFQKEMDMFNAAFLEVMSEGDANGRVFTFPIPTYNITEDFDWDSDISQLLWETTGKYGLPYFSNFINSDMKPEDARSMCCRLRIDNQELQKRGGGLFGAHPLTGSIGVVTINLPRLGYISRDQYEFMKLLREQMVLARNSLEIKRKVLENFTEKDLYPYTKHYLRKVKEESGYYWANHFSTIGIIGMNEALLNLLGENIASRQGVEFAKEVMDMMREELTVFQQETGNNYNLEATPAEGATYRLARLDQEKYDRPVFANGVGTEVADPFYTNSTHLPVNFTDDIFEELELQDDLQSKYTGGTVLHFFLGERVTEPNGIKKVVESICSNYQLPYFTITPSFSICPRHGYLSGEVEECHSCGNRCEVYSRVVGYLRPVEQWNKGKQSEFALRTNYQTGNIS